MSEEMLRIEVPISYDDVSQGLCGMVTEELVKLILQVDLQMAEVGFTEDLVRGLVKSLKADKDDVDLPFIDWSKVK